jgi:SMODS-associated and fused to various effectors sensor domain
LTRFKDGYQAALRTIAHECGQIEAIHLFPAVPAPVAVFCGRELLPKVDPKLIVYDYDKRLGGFTLAIEVN